MKTIDKLEIALDIMSDRQVDEYSNRINAEEEREAELNEEGHQ